METGSERYDCYGCRFPPPSAIGVQDGLQAKDVRQNNLVIWKRFNYPLSTNNVDSIRDKFNMLNPLMDERLRHADGHGRREPANTAGAGA